MDQGRARRLHVLALCACVGCGVAMTQSPVCMTPGLPTLDELAHKYGSGKAVKTRGGSATVKQTRSDGGGHGFAHSYARALERRRQDVTRVMEFGVFFGASILMWRDYFPRAQVVGVDTFAGQLGHGPRFSNATIFLDLWRAGKVGERIHLIQADQSEAAELDRVMREADAAVPADEPAPSGPCAAGSGRGMFDLIVDDASHRMRDQQLTLAATFALLKPCGIYVLEDIHTSLQVQYRVRRVDRGMTTLAMIEQFERGAGFNESKHVTAGQAGYLNRWVEGCARIVPRGGRSVLSQTAICYKRAVPLPVGSQLPPTPPTPAELATRMRLYAPDEYTVGDPSHYLRVRSERRCIT